MDSTSIITLVVAFVAFLTSIVSVCISYFLNKVSTFAAKKIEIYDEFIEIIQLATCSQEEQHEQKLNKRYIKFKESVILYGSKDVIFLLAEYGSDFDLITKENKKRFPKLLNAMRKDMLGIVRRPKRGIEAEIINKLL